MKLSDILKGRRARNPIELRLGEQVVKLDVRVLGPDDDINISSAAIAFAKSKGVADPSPGDDLYEQAARVETLLRACIDHDSPEDAPAPFFASVEEILTSPLLSRDHIAFLVEAQERWQDECSPRPRQLTTGEYVKLVAAAATGDMNPFFQLAPATAWLCMRSMARQLIDSQTPKSSPSSPSEATSN